MYLSHKDTAEKWLAFYFLWPADCWWQTKSMCSHITWWVNTELSHHFNVFWERIQVKKIKKKKSRLLSVFLLSDILSVLRSCQQCLQLSQTRKKFKLHWWDLLVWFHTALYDAQCSHFNTEPLELKGDLGLYFQKVLKVVPNHPFLFK